MKPAATKKPTTKRPRSKPKTPVSLSTRCLNDHIFGYCLRALIDPPCHENYQICPNYRTNTGKSHHEWLRWQKAISISYNSNIKPKHDLSKLP